MMWKTSIKSPVTTTGLSFQSLNSGRSQQLQQAIPFPSLISDSMQYSRLYDKIYKSQQKAFYSLRQDEQKQYINKIKDSISDKLLQQQKQKSFRKKFGKSTPNSVRKVLKHTKNALLGLTSQQQNNSQLMNFMMDHKRALQLQEQARLFEYYLKDQEKKKTKIDYINRVQLAERHRRTQSNSKNRSEKMFKVNNQKQYHLLRKTAYIINDRLMSKSLACAKKNPTYRRVKNFSQIQYILNQDHQNVMINKQIPVNPQKQKLFNIKRRIFVNLAVVSESVLAYYQYIKQKDFNKLIELILPESENQQALTKVTPSYVNKLISKITKYKQTKVIHFQDFLQLLQTIKQQRQYNVIQKLTQKFRLSELSPSSNSFALLVPALVITTMNFRYKKFFKIQVDQFLQNNRDQINELIKTHKMQVIARKIYALSSTKIVGRDYLPLRQIVEFMKEISIIPKAITMSKFMFYSYWYQMRVEGFNIDEFINIQVAIGFELEGNLAGVEKYFSMFDVKAILSA